MPTTQISSRRISSGLLVSLSCFLVGCAGPAYTVDDGSKVDEKFLSNIRLFGQGEQAIRPNIVRSAELKDPDCSKQWELPFSVATSYDLDRPKKIAWARALTVDERLSVIAAADNSGLRIGDKVEKLDGYHRDNTEKMMLRLIELRDNGDPFDITLASGKVIKIKPFEVCRGHVSITPPAHPEVQDYHWLASVHALFIFNQPLTRDEALWIVLWTQGLSEEASLRMKTYHYGMKTIKFAVTTASIVSGVGAVANAAQGAAAQIAAQQASNAATSAAAQQASKFLAEQAMDAARDKALVALKEIAKTQAQDIALDSMKSAALFRSSLSGISWVAGTGFYMADEWAFKRMQKLGANPLAAFTLHYKLASTANAQNAFVFDEDRLEDLSVLAADAGIDANAKNILAGNDPNFSPVELNTITLDTVSVTYVSHESPQTTTVASTKTPVLMTNPTTITSETITPLATAPMPAENH